jgi:hypothetical protein
MCGSDWRFYEEVYLQAQWSDLRKYNSEYGFYLLVNMLKATGLSFWPFLIITKTVVFIIILKTVELFKISRWAFLGLSFPFLMYLFIDNPLRNMIAIGLFLLSVKHLVKNEPVKYYLLVLLATQFHVSAYILLLIYPLRNVRLVSSNILIGYLLLFLVLGQKDLIIWLLSHLTLLSPAIFGRIEGYLMDLSAFDASGSFLSLRSIIIIGVLILMVIFRRRISDYKAYGDAAFMLTILYMISFRLGLSFQVLVRLTYYFFLFYVVIIMLIAKCITNIRTHSIYWLGFILITVYSSYSLASVDFRYVPYTNYFVYLVKNGGLPDYETRSEHNMILSPYRNKELGNE